MRSTANLLGHPIHQMLIVLPLGLLVSAVAFDACYLFSGLTIMAQVAYWNIALGIITGLAAAVFGFRDWLSIPEGTRAKAIGAWHGGGNVLVVALFAVAWMVRRDNLNHVPETLALVMEFAALGLGG